MAAVACEIVAPIAAGLTTTTTEVVAASAWGWAAEITPLPGLARAVFCDIQAERASCDLAPMELLNCLLGVFFFREPNESKASGAAGFAVLRDVDIHDLTNFTEELSKLFVRGGKVEVPYEYLV